MIGVRRHHRGAKRTPRQSTYIQLTAEMELLAGLGGWTTKLGQYGCLCHPDRNRQSKHTKYYIALLTVDGTKFKPKNELKLAQKTS